MGEAGFGVEESGEPLYRRSRWPLAILAGVVLVVLLTAGWWFIWVPNWRPGLRQGERYGIDVSAHQELINWRAVAGDDIEFAYIKATEGGDFVDRRFAENWRLAGHAGLDRGAYHFFTLCTDGAAQAANFLRVASPEPGALAPAVDLELVGNCKRRPSPAELDTELSRFLSIIEDAWHTKAVLYVGDEFERRYPARERLGRPLWHRRFLRRPNVKGWTIWQLHGYARISGIDGGVDLNVMRASP
jgi:lysozyme